jgi:hypothetical protein
MLYSTFKRSSHIINITKRINFFYLHLVDWKIYSTFALENENNTFTSDDVMFDKYRAPNRNSLSRGLRHIRMPIQRDFTFATATKQTGIECTEDFRFFLLYALQSDNYLFAY